MPTTVYNAIWRLVVVAALLSGRFAFGPAHADQFTLRSGGRLDGEWLNPDKGPQDAYEIQTRDGGKLTLAQSQVEEVVRQRPAEIEYERIAPTFANTATAQWELAEWCRQRQLLDKRHHHLQRILEMDPDHAPARHALGYSQVGGQWVLRPNWQQDQGYVFYRGRWRLPQDVELLEVNAKRERAEREWLGKLTRFRSNLATDSADEAGKQIVAIRDPHAVRALGQLLKKERYRAVKLLYIEALRQIGTPAAVAVLIEASLNDPDVEIFYTCVDEIVRLRQPTAVAAYIKGLQDANNVRVNRSGYALGQLGDASAIGALIDALITTHTIVIAPPGGRSADAVTATFDSSPGQSSPISDTGLRTGDQTKIFSTQVQNKEVLQALVKLSNGVSFGYEQRVWKNWLSLTRERPRVINARRD